MHDFQEQLRTPGNETAAAVGHLSDPSTVLDSEDLDGAQVWTPWAE